MSNNSNVVTGSFQRNWLARTLDQITTWNDRRLAAAQLNAMSDRLLQDVGINRYEIGTAVKRPADYATLSAVRGVVGETSKDLSRAA
jgi:uncharacterized protein YjiS (DUF1127 family)